MEPPADRKSSNLYDTAVLDGSVDALDENTYRVASDIFEVSLKAHGSCQQL